MMTCRQARRVAFEALSHKPALRQRAGLRLHLAVCQTCARQVRRLRAMYQTMRQHDQEGLTQSYGRTLDEQSSAMLRTAIENELTPRL